MTSDRGIMEAAVDRACTLGADVAGWVPASRLTGSPSAVAEGGGFSTENGSFLVLGLAHPPEKPELDYWEEGRGTPGDRMLGWMAADIGRWLADAHGREARVIPYQIYDGGIYLKDAAVLAGLGVMGMNNLVLVPGHGPRIRFRALWTDLEPGEPDIADLESPCEGCDRPSLSACPMDAFPDGEYSRSRCMERMNQDRASTTPVDHCRICELSCRAK
ncbi:MAG: hypothetical protein ACP5C4_05415 [Methanomicrobiales archaeon]